MSRITQAEYIELMTKKKPSKHWNIKTNGFASKLESNRYQQLVILERAWVIKDLKTQVPFILLDSFEIDWVKIQGIKYMADFTYEVINLPWFDKGLWCEDTKGNATDVYKIKKKLFLARYGKEYNFFENYG